jgi:Tol biopolymer transport system component
MKRPVDATAELFWAYGPAIILGHMEGVRGIRSAAAVAAGLVAVLFALLPTAAAAKPRAVIIFDRYVTSSPVNDNDIFSIRPGGSHENILVDTDYNDWGVAASPNGGLLAFSSDRDSDGNNEIFVQRPDGTHLHQLTHSPDAYSEWPSFTPDGKRILFDSDLKGSYNEIHIMRTDGSHLHALTRGSNGSFDAVMSPDGRKIAFSRFVGTAGNEEIFRMRADGSHERRLTHNPSRDELPSWFANSKKLAFESDRDGDDEIFTMRSDGSRQRHLTRNNGVNDVEPALSPNGKRIAFGRTTQPGNEDIWVMDADGSHRHRVTYDPRSEEYPDWAKLR